MKHKEYFKDFDDFDEESQQILLFAYDGLLLTNTFQQNKLLPEQVLQKTSNININDSSSSVSDITDLVQDEYVNLNLLIGKIKLSNSGLWDFQFAYDSKDLVSKVSNKSISNNKGGLIPLKVYRNLKVGNVGVKWDEAKITQTIDVQNKKIYYRLSFYYKDIKETAFILETPIL